ncbi:hypothetical protein CEQ28_023515 [Hafnia alvei]|nr:hypothetical protein CEQ28_023515 [Hafnia alvei]
MPRTNYAATAINGVKQSEDQQRAVEAQAQADYNAAISEQNRQQIAKEKAAAKIAQQKRQAQLAINISEPMRH